MPCAVVAGAAEGRAAADEIAPELEVQELRQTAVNEGKRLFEGLDAASKRRLVGLYVAFEDNAADPGAMASCDDDGDYVIVLSDAMLRLAANVARAATQDEESGSRTVEDYASFVARSQVRGRRLLPPPAGFFTAAASGDARETRLREALSFVLARELAHLRAGDLVCARPTATHEHGDDVWTAAEQRWATVAASTLYPGRAAERDAEATSRVVAAGRSEAGALALLRFFVRLDSDRAALPARFVPSYAAQHPGAASRVATVVMAAGTENAARAGEDGGR